MQLALPFRHWFKWPVPPARSTRSDWAPWRRSSRQTVQRDTSRRVKAYQRPTRARANPARPRRTAASLRHAAGLYIDPRQANADVPRGSSAWRAGPRGSMQSGRTFPAPGLGPECRSYLRRRAISVPTATPQAKPKANMPILTGEDTFPQIATDEETAITKKSSAVPSRALFDFMVLHPCSATGRASTPRARRQLSRGRRHDDYAPGEARAEPMRGRPVAPAGRDGAPHSAIHWRPKKSLPPTCRRPAARPART